MRKTNVLMVMLLLVGSICLPGTAQETYRQPPQRIAEILDVPPTPILRINPQGGSYFLMEFTYLVDLPILARNLLKLAGIRFWPDFSSLQRSAFVQKVTVRDPSGKRDVVLQLPKGSQGGAPVWSPDGRHLSMQVFQDTAAAIWVFDPKTGQGKAVTPPKVNSILADSHVWTRDSRHLLIPLIPEHRGAPPTLPAVPSGPIIEQTSGTTAKLRTFQDLLANPFDEALFAFYGDSQLVEVGVADGRTRNIGKPALLRQVSPSPDGKFLLIDRLRPPFSRVVPEDLFGHTLEVWDRNGHAVKIIADLPAAENLPIQGVPEGPRDVAWQPLHPHALIWTEAQDGGDPARKVPFREKIVRLATLSESSPEPLFLLPQRFAGFDWLNRKNLVLTADYDRDRKWLTTRLFDISAPTTASAARTIFDRSVHDEYQDPGEVVHMSLPSGERLGILDGDWVYLAGEGATPEGKRPFLRKFNLKSGARHTVFQSEKQHWEEFEGFCDSCQRLFITNRESPVEPPNYLLRSVSRGKAEAGRFLTAFPDPAPELSKIRKELVRYQRDDGIPLSGMLYYPLDYEAGKKYPAIVWAYPREYVDPGTAGQVRGTNNRFTRLEASSILFFLLHGYVVLDSAEMPVVGHPETANDTYIEQVTAAARAAVDVLVSRGLADPGRIGVAGHSYGANMTAHLLAHTDLFAAGIARSGAFNRTLTPFGFQGERRTFWEVPEIYLKLSPFSSAHKINEPLLLIHGELDENSGTFPMQSERLFGAIRGAGGTAKLVKLPLEGHAYRARESVLHVLAEMFDWFDQHLKNRQQKEQPRLFKAPR